MSIRTKLILLFAIIAALPIIFFFNHIYEEWKEAEDMAIFDAQNTAKAIALSLTSVDKSMDLPPIYKRPSMLNDYISDMRRLLEQDIAVVDEQKKIIGDALNLSNIGNTFDNDKNNEVGQTIKDSALRVFIERNIEHPEGARNLVIPLKTEEGEIAGAVIFEYTSYYKAHISHAKEEAKKILIQAFFLALLVAAIGYAISAKIAGPVINLKKAADEIAKGNLDIRVDIESKDELGDLTSAFNSMAALRKTAEEALRSSEERFRTVAEFAGDAIIGIKTPGIICLWNRKAMEIFGYTEDEAMGKNLHELIVPERYREKVLVPLTAFFQTGKGPVIGKTLGVEALRGDGKEFPVELSISAVNREGTWQALGIVRDITERKKSEEEMARLNWELLEKMNKLERFHRITLDREQRIIEIKNEVNELLEKAGKPKRYEWAGKGER